MILILLLIGAAVLGYYLARSQYSDPIDSTADRVATTSKSWTKQAEDFWYSKVRRRKEPNGFLIWAAGPGAEHLPEDFRAWLDGLSEQEAREFTSALADYSSGLGFSLSALVEGQLDNQPALMTVFVEAIVVYSQEYRKAREAQEEVEEKPDRKAESKEEKKPAEKRASRRKNQSTASAEPASP
jgi:hypothetical protein